MKLRILTVALVVWAGGAHAALFDNIFVFGDSLSDGGNAFAITGGFPPYVTYPGPVFTQRPTNGPTAAEVMSAQLGTPATASQSGGSNYAVMGAATQAYTRTDLPDAPPILAGLPKPGSVTTHNYVPFGYWYLDSSSLGAAGFGLDNLKLAGVDNQVQAFKSLPPSQDPNRSLFMIWTGVNDFLLGGATGFLAAADNISSFVGDLYDDPAIAARTFFVPNIPDLARTPDSLAAFAMLPPADAALQAALLRGLTTQFNADLAANLEALEASHPGLNVVQFDTFSFVDAILDDASAYGFTNTTDACVDRNDPLVVCSNPDQYAFWDGFHPSAASHALLGAAFAGAITQAIPEPQTYVLLAAGLILLLIARRRAIR
jgi:phospholipase/lecithinase/hemolysin